MIGLALRSHEAANTRGMAPPPRAHKEKGRPALRRPPCRCCAAPLLLRQRARQHHQNKQGSGARPQPPRAAFYITPIARSLVGCAAPSPALPSTAAYSAIRSSTVCAAASSSPTCLCPAQTGMAQPALRPTNARRPTFQMQNVRRKRRKRREVRARLHVLCVVVEVEVALPELPEAVAHALERVADARVVRQREERVRHPDGGLRAQPHLRAGGKGERHGDPAARVSSPRSPPR